MARTSLALPEFIERWKASELSERAAAQSQFNDLCEVLGQLHQFEAAGLERKHWSTASPVRTIFREAFQRAGLLYFHPHSLRKTLAPWESKSANHRKISRRGARTLGMNRF